MLGAGTGELRGEGRWPIAVESVDLFYMHLRER